MNNELSINKRRGAIVYTLIFVICSLLLVTGCQDPFTLDNAAPIPGKGSFSLMLSGAGRTVLPNTPATSDFAVYNLLFTDTDDEEAANEDRTDETLSDPILLEPGTYSLVVTAYKDDEKTLLMARGTLNGIVITAGESTAAAVTLEALLAEGTGIFRWEINVPQEVTTASMTIAPLNESGTDEETVTLSDNNYTGEYTLNSGQYNLTINLESPSGKVAWKELLYVYHNLESVLTLEFTNDYFINDNYTVAFNSSEGSNVGEQSVLHGNTVQEPTAPTREGCTFDGWYQESNLTTLWNFDTAVIKAMTLYAGWKVTVTFNSNEGSAVAEQTIRYNTKANRPANPTKEDHGFIDWYSDETLTTVYNFNESVTSAITLYAKWGAIAVSADDIADFGANAVIANTFTVSNQTEWNSAISAINANGNDRNYIINITGSLSIPGTTAANFSPTGINISIRGTGGQTISLSSNGSLLFIGSQQKMIIRDLTLKGRKNNVDSANSDNNVSLINNSGTVELKGTASVTDNVNLQQQGASNGGGVSNNGTFIMWDNSSVTGNSAVSNAAQFITVYEAYGGGINNMSTLIMRDNASITNNTAVAGKVTANNYTYPAMSQGGGVYNSGTFIMRENASITGNSLSATGGEDPITKGGGVSTHSSALGEVRIEGCAISGNSAANGASLYVYQYNVDGIYNNGRIVMGTFNNSGVWTATNNGALSTTDNSIRVINGVLIDQHIVTFTADSGSPAPTQQLVDPNGKAKEPPPMTRTYYTFGGWYTEAELTNQWDFANDTVTESITLYAKWLPNPGTPGITINVKQITEGAPEINADITISRSGSNGNPVTFPVTVDNHNNFSSITWTIAGAGVYAGQTVTGSGATFTLDAEDFMYNTFGGHALILTVTKDGQQYQRAIPFTIEQ